MSEDAPEGGQQNDTGTGAGQEGQGEEHRSFTAAELEDMIKSRLDRERRKYADYGDLKKKASEFDRLAEQQKSEAEKAVEAARREGRAEALRASNDRMLKLAAQTAGAGKLADPADAPRYLDLGSFEVGDDGEIDMAAMGAAVDELVKSKPYLAAQPAGSQGGGGNGPRGGKPGGPAQITSREELRSMSSAEIVKAQREGRLDRLLRGD